MLAGKYLNLSPRQRSEVVLAAIVKYNVANDRMIEAFAERPVNYINADGTPQRHAPFAGQYALDLVNAALNARFGHRKAFQEGWGVRQSVIKKLADAAVLERASWVRQGIAKSEAVCPVPVKAV